MNSRRTRAATSKATTNGHSCTSNGYDANHAIDYASPKRKDCKLDMSNVPSTQTAINGHHKRAPKNANKHKKAVQPITNFFSTNGHHYPDCDDKTMAENYATKALNLDLANGDSREFPALSQSPMGARKKATPPPPPPTPPQPSSDNMMRNSVNGNSHLFASPKPNMFNGSGGVAKQTTPHRIFVRLSPKKQKPSYAKNNPVDVFQQLNIGEGASPKTKSNRIGGKRESQKTRRKLIVGETENASSTADDNIVPLSASGIVADAVVVDAKKPILNSSVDPTAQQNTTNNNKKLMPPPSQPPPIGRGPRETQLTDFFPIRRSARRTKKAVEQEQLRYIELAIEKQLEDGLVVQEFGEKGRGIVAGRPFARGDFVVEYIGELIDQNEADRREESYAKNVDFGCYMYYFKHKEQQWCIDATAESGKLGRLVNHSRNGNLITKIVSSGGLPHLVLLAKDDIDAGVELTYDYGDRRREALIHHPWLAF